MKDKVSFHEAISGANNVKKQPPELIIEVPCNVRQKSEPNKTIDSMGTDSDMRRLSPQQP